ncbi:MAG: hypothetical protein ABWY27_02015, partial [Telluria sp.]
MHTFHLMLARNKLDTCQIPKVRNFLSPPLRSRAQSVSSKPGQTRFLFGWPRFFQNRGQTQFFKF